MLTPQRKVWSGWSLTPRSETGQKNGSESGSDPKGKSVDFVEQVTPNGVRPNLDGEDLADKVSKLENEVGFYWRILVNPNSGELVDGITLKLLIFDLDVVLGPDCGCCVMSAYAIFISKKVEFKVGKSLRVLTARLTSTAVSKLLGVISAIIIYVSGWQI
ncbi:hypothetical protein OIU84_028773 [Salix udensis]|uniref:Uncharacterized protein n=1 Tax=Salix udensis TaxID=889485 RepID=A0AAD6KDB4_9ROSI|nr:hypothetical protein OIU84_028773 [Salix udensis]